MAKKWTICFQEAYRQTNRKLQYNIENAATGLTEKDLGAHRKGPNKQNREDFLQEATLKMMIVKWQLLKKLLLCAKPVL